MNKTIKTFVFSFGLAILLLSSNSLSAQDRGLFGMGKSSADYEYSGSKGMMDISGNSDEGISNYGIGQDAPIGSGIIILLGAGLGYMAFKKKEDEQ